MTSEIMPHLIYISTIIILCLPNIFTTICVTLGSVVVFKSILPRFIGLFIVVCLKVVELIIVVILFFLKTDVNSFGVVPFRFTVVFGGIAVVVIFLFIVIIDGIVILVDVVVVALTTR